MHSRKHLTQTSPTRREALLALLGSALLPACGGGTDLAGISSGGTGSFTSGTIVGLGSVIVNGIRYDDSAASVRFNDGVGSPADLQLGMVVRIRGSSLTPASTTGGLATGTAAQIDCSSAWKGPVTNVNLSDGTFLLLGQPVRVLASTIFSGGQFSGDLDGRYAEVYGFVDPANGRLQASRVEVDTEAPSRYRLSGVISNLTSGTFQLGSATIDHSTASNSSTLRNGLLVRVDLLPSPNTGGQWVATEVRADDYSGSLEDEDEAEIEGAITAFTSVSAFSVNGIPVDASQIQPPSGLALGVRVEVKGSVRNGTVIAHEVDIEDDSALAAQAYEFHGNVSGLDTGTRRFIVRGYTIRYDGNTAFALNGAVWEDGLAVEVKARLDAAGELLATQIEADH